MTLIKRSDVVIVGAGIMGVASADALTRRGRSVSILDRFHVPHERGSSHGRSRIYRLSYREADHVAMAREAGELWRRLETDSSDQVLHVTGGLDLGEGVEENARALAANDVPHELGEGREFAKRSSSVAFDPYEPVLFQADAGILEADRAHGTMLTLTRKRGGDLYEGETVEAIEPGEAGVRIPFPKLVFEAQVAVVTAGAWANEVLRPLGIELPVTVTRESVAYFSSDRAVPPPVVEWGETTYYSLPSPGQGIKAAQHGNGPQTDPNQIGELDRVSLGEVERWVTRRFPEVDPLEHHAETCLYTNTPDERFILERHDRVVVGSPCSGHGFKFAPLIGERLADLAEEALG